MQRAGRKHSGRRNQNRTHVARSQRSRNRGGRTRTRIARPPAAYRQRGRTSLPSEPFYAPETWHEPTGQSEIEYVVEPPGPGYHHPVTVEEVRARIAKLPSKFTRGVEVVQFSRMTKKRALFPCYGLQWGPNIYLYPIESSLVEHYAAAPIPQQSIEADMYGGRWEQHGERWTLTWTADSIRDFYLNNVLIHEIGHVNDARNTRSDAREAYANWFAVEYGYRASRKRA